MKPLPFSENGLKGQQDSELQGPPEARGVGLGWKMEQRAGKGKNNIPLWQAPDPKSSVGQERPRSFVGSQGSASSATLPLCESRQSAIPEN